MIHRLRTRHSDDRRRQHATEAMNPAAPTAGASATRAGGAQPSVQEARESRRAAELQRLMTTQEI